MKPLTSKVLVQLGPDTVELAQSIADFVCEMDKLDLDDVETFSEFELFGLIVAKANMFIQRAQDDESSRAESLMPLKEVHQELTVYLRQMRLAAEAAGAHG